MRGTLCRLLGAERHELAALGWAFAYFFLLLAGYYVLRPVRDEMAVQAGAGRLQWLFTATFLAMLALVPAWGWLCARLPRAKLLPAVYAFFILNLLGFWGAFQTDFSKHQTTSAFFVWVSVFNLFAVSVFWSFMADLFDRAQAARLFAAITAGGSCGAIAGPALSAQLATRIGPANLLLVSALLLSFALLCICGGLLINLGESRYFTHQKRIQELDAYMRWHSTYAYGRAIDMASFCRRLIVTSGTTGGASPREFQESERWAASAAEALQRGYESYQWRQFLLENRNVKASEDRIIQQLKFSVLTVLMEMNTRDTELQNLFKRSDQRGQLLWLAPTAPWLLVFGFALRITKVGADWRMASVGRES